MFDNIWFVPPQKDKLVSPYDLYDTSQPIVAAQPFSVSMTTVVVAEDLDGFLRGKNDILILSRSSLGTQPQVERVHFYEEDVEKGEPIKNLLADSVFVTDDYNGKDRLWLEVNVLEIDTDTGERKGAVQAFESLAATAGAVFPVIVPYAFAASAAVNVVEKLISALEKDDKVVKVPLALYPDLPKPGRAPLQAGSFVAFPQPVDPDRYVLEKSGALTEKGKPAGISYCVFTIVPVQEVVPEFVLSQKVATLLTQITRGNGNTAQNTIQFVEDTLTQYTRFSKLRRYADLAGKQKRSPQEQSLMDQIGSIEELKAFLPKK